MDQMQGPPKTFSITFSKADGRTYLFPASQVLPVARSKAIGFFEDPRDLIEITPDWLDSNTMPCLSLIIYE
jgi:hypothetical protein